MARWFSSDWHLGHENIIRFCQRPYTNAEHMNQGIAEAMYEHVAGDDELWLIGDIAMGNVDQTLRLLARMPGRLTLVAGNHDRIHPLRSRHTQWMDTYRQRCPNIENIYERGTSIQLAGTDMLVNHFPYAHTDARAGVVNGKEVTDRFAKYRESDEGGWLLCGHVHEKWRQQGRMINVGIDAWGGKPVSEAQLGELVHAGARDLPSLAWA